MIGQTISHYRILEKLGEVPNVPTSASPRVVVHLSIPACSPTPKGLRRACFYELSKAGRPPYFGGSGRDSI